MKNILAILILLPCAAMAQEYSFHLKGQVKEWKGKDTVRLIYTVNNVPVTDSAIAVNGRFEFKGRIPQPVLTYISLLKPIDRNQVRDNYHFYLEEGTYCLRQKIHFVTVRFNRSMSMPIIGSWKRPPGHGLNG